MRKFALLLFIAAAAGCSSEKSPESKAQEQITAYLKDNLNNPDTYEPIRFSPARHDSSRLHQDLINAYMDSARKYLDLVEYRYTYPNALDDASFWMDKYDSLLKVSPTTVAGYIIMHSFRRSNSKGSKVIDSLAFRFDTTWKLKHEKYYSFINDDKGAARFDAGE